MGKATWHGNDKAGRPCCIVLPRLHDPTRSTEAGVVRLILYTLEEGVKRAESNGQDRVVVLYDRQGMTMANVDRRLFALAQKVCLHVVLCGKRR
jgi:hypothetical protein